MLSESVSRLQKGLYEASKSDPERRFHSLRDKVYRPDVLEAAWRAVRANGGKPGVDGQSIEDVEKHGVDSFLRELHGDLKSGAYRALPVRRVLIPKASGGTRALGIPTVRDRVAQAAVKIVLEPIFEADFLPCSFGYRPGLSPKMASLEVRKYLNFGMEFVVDADIHACFDEIPHGPLLEAVAARVSDGFILGLIRQWLKSGVMIGGGVERREEGTPQGGVISPLLCNVYLHRLDLEWERRGWMKRYGPNAQLVRFADDILILSPNPVEGALEELRSILSEMGLTLSEKKTRLVKAEEGFDFLGFRFVRRHSRKRGKRVTYFYPSPRSVKRVRETVRKKCGTHVAHRDPKEVAKDLNKSLRGWKIYFRHSNAHRVFAGVEDYVLKRFRKCLRRRKNQSGLGYREWPDDKTLFERFGLARIAERGSVRYARQTPS